MLMLVVNKNGFFNFYVFQLKIMENENNNENEDEDDVDNAEFIRENYNKPGSPFAYSNPQTIYKYLKKIGRKTSINVIRNIISEFDAHNLHKQFKRPKFFNPYYIYSRREQIQADLIDIRELSKYNKGTSYLFTLIDCFTKKAWVYPLKTKKTKEVADVFVEHIENDYQNRLPQILMTDAGKEFVGKEMQDVLNDYSIYFQIGRGYNKVSICERFNFTLQLLIYKYLTQNETLDYLSALSDIVKTYNNRPHRTLKGLSPEEADKPSMEVYLRGIHRARYHNIKRQRLHNLKNSFQVGDVVRIKKATKRISTENRGYKQQQNPEYFTIIRIDSRLPRPQYYIKSMSEGDIIDGAFYSNELSLVKGNIWKIDKVIRTKGKGKNKKYLVKWSHFNEEHNSWVDEKDFTANYE